MNRLSSGRSILQRGQPVMQHAVNARPSKLSNTLAMQLVQVMQLPECRPDLPTLVTKLAQPAHRLLPTIGFITLSVG